MHVPGIGSRAGLLRRPGSVALAALFGLMLFVSTLFTTHRRQRDRPRGSRGARLPTRAPSAPVIVLALTAVLFGGLAALAFGHAGRGPTPTSVKYEQTGTFSYSAAAARGAAYPLGRATTGDPLFLRLVRDADVGFAYRFVSTAGHRVDGVAGLTATVASTTISPLRF